MQLNSVVWSARARKHFDAVWNTVMGSTLEDSDEQLHESTVDQRKSLWWAVRWRTQTQWRKALWWAIASEDQTGWRRCNCSIDFWKQTNAGSSCFTTAIYDCCSCWHNNNNNNNNNNKVLTAPIFIWYFTCLEQCNCISVVRSTQEMIFGKGAQKVSAFAKLHPLQGAAAPLWQPWQKIKQAMMDETYYVRFSINFLQKNICKSYSILNAIW